VGDDPDDPAIWIHPTNPSQSLVIATNKTAVPSGALVVYDLEGKIVQTIVGLDRPNNVDIRQSVLADEGGTMMDIAAVTERYRSSVRLYRIEASSRKLSELPPLGGFKVFEGEQGDNAAPMGIALYRRPVDGALFAIVGRKSGPAEGYLWQYRLGIGTDGAVSAELVRKFGAYSGRQEIESIAVDDALGYVYYSDEAAGVRKYYADPDHPDAARELAFFGQTGYEGDHEGLAIYATSAREGYLISTDQIEGRSRYFVYRREGTLVNLHDHSEVLAVIEGGADSTDGIEVTPVPLGPRYPHGLLAAMNSASKNFLFYAWPERLLPGNR
jgi:3-phytase